MNPILKFFFGFLLIVVEMNVSAQQISPLPLDDPESSIRRIEIGITGKREAAYVHLQYDPSEGPFRTALEAKLRKLPLNPPEGFEEAPYSVYVYARADWDDPQFNFIVYFGGDLNPVYLEKADTGWKLPDSAFSWTKYDIQYAGVFSFLQPTVTDFEIRAWRGAEELFFSTKTGKNNVEGCDFLAIRDALRTQKVLQIPREFLISQKPWDKVELIRWEGDVETVQTHTRLPPNTKPLSLAIRKNGGTVEVLVSGDGAAGALIEESKDLRVWESAYSLSSPPTTSSDGGEYRRTVTTTGDIRFYRLRRLPLEVQ